MNDSKYRYINNYNNILNICKSCIIHYNMLLDPKNKNKSDKINVKLIHDNMDDENVCKLIDYLSRLSNLDVLKSKFDILILERLENEFYIYQSFISDYINEYGIERAISNKDITNKEQIGYPGTYWSSLIK
jgi:hypothetical protein